MTQLDLSTFKVKGKSFVYKMEQFSSHPYTAVCLECKKQVESKCKIHPREKYVVCVMCGTLCCWKTWNKTHSNQCKIAIEPWYQEVEAIRTGKPKPQPIPVHHHQPVPSPTTRLQHRQYLPSDIFDQVITNRFSQIIPNVLPILKYDVNGVVCYCRHCHLLLTSPSELCQEHAHLYKKYTDLNKYICTTCGQNMSYSTYKRHFRNNVCKNSTQPGNQKYTNYSQFPELNPVLIPHLSSIQPLGDDVLLLLNDLANQYPSHVQSYLSQIYPITQRFHPLLFQPELIIENQTAQDILHQLQHPSPPSIFEPLSPISMSTCSTLSNHTMIDDSILNNGQNGNFTTGLPTHEQLNELFSPALSMSSASSISLELPTIPTEQNEILTILTDKCEELIIFITQYYSVYELFEQLVNNIMEDTWKSTGDLKQRIIDLSLILDNKQSSCFTRVFTTEFKLSKNEEGLFNLLNDKKIELQNQLIACEIYKEKAEEYLALVDLSVGNKLIVANKRLDKLMQDVSRIEKERLFSE
eukprot:NODE_18_length_47517_cov_0.674814.p7 type:complete len:524 gc:universal NODE_18_length_47517_cov_0.674814:30752-32323(+)